MGDLSKLKCEIENLSLEEQAEIRDWLLARDFDGWDRQIEADLAAGKLDRLIAEAESQRRDGRVRDL